MVGRDAFLDIGARLEVLPPPARGRRLIAVIGIDRYREWPVLSNAVNDARGALTEFVRLGFEPVADPLVDELATYEAIRNLVSDGLAKLDPADSLVLFFAGHGHTVKQTFADGGEVKTGFIIPVDADSPEGSTARWIRLDTWLSDVARLAAKHILVFLDACHSGIALGSLVKWRDAGDRTEALTSLAERRSRRVITSAMDDQRALDSGPVANHSLFTGLLIDGLHGGIAKPGELVTGSEIGQYLQKRVASFTGSQQTPDYGALEQDLRGELLLEIADPAVPPMQQAPPSVEHNETTWSFVEAELRWHGEGASPEPIRRGRGEQLVEARVTLKWGGKRPDAPAMRLRTRPLWGRWSRPVGVWSPESSIGPGTATWRATTTIAPRYLRTTQIRVDVDDKSASRFLMSSLGTFAAAVIWLAVLGCLFAAFAHVGTLAVVPGFAVWVVGGMLGWLASRAATAASPRMLLRIPFEVVVLAPVVLAAGLFLPPRLLVVVENNASVPVKADGISIDAFGSKAFLMRPDRLTFDGTLACRCGRNPQCRCDPPPAGWLAISRIQVNCWHRERNVCVDFDYFPVEGSPGAVVKAPLRWPAGFRPITISPAALRNAVKFGPIELTSPPDPWPARPVDLPVMQGTNLDITYGGDGHLHCEATLGIRPLNVDVLELRHHVSTLEVNHGAAWSKWEAGNSKEAPHLCWSDDGPWSVSVDRNPPIPCAKLKQLRFLAVEGDVPAGFVFHGDGVELIRPGVVATCAASGTDKVSLENGAERSCSLDDIKLTCKVNYAAAGCYEVSGQQQIAFKQPPRTACVPAALGRHAYLRDLATARGVRCTSYYDCRY